MKKRIFVCIILLFTMVAMYSPALAADSAPVVLSHECSLFHFNLLWSFIGWKADADFHTAQYKCGCNAETFEPTEYRFAHSGGNATCSAKAICETCEASYGDFAEHELVHHEGKEATCTEAGWTEYDTCKNCRYTTYQEIQKLDHDIVHHAGQKATCTEAGWAEYDTCKNCSYTTYQEICALNHDIVHHEGKEATCTEAGWTEYDTCARCDYTTYFEIAALDHDYQEKETVEPTCSEGGYTVYTCARCGDSYTADYVE